MSEETIKSIAQLLGWIGGGAIAFYTFVWPRLKPLLGILPAPTDLDERLAGSVADFNVMLKAELEELKKRFAQLEAKFTVAVQERDEARQTAEHLRVELDDERKLSASLAVRCDELDAKMSDMERRLAAHESVNQFIAKLTEVLDARLSPPPPAM